MENLLITEEPEWLTTMVLSAVGVMSLIAALVMVLKGVSLWRSVFGDAEPRHSPPLHQVYATKPELHNLKKEMDAKILEVKQGVDRGFDAVRSDIREYNNRSEERTKAVHERVNTILSEVSQLKGRLTK